MKVLIKFSRDWADEFQAEGLALLSPSDWDELKAKLAEPQDFYFGTNEGWEAEVLLESCKAEEISDEDAAVLERLIPDLKVRTFGTENQYSTSPTFGIFPHVGDTL